MTGPSSYPRRTPFCFLLGWPFSALLFLIGPFLSSFGWALSVFFLIGPFCLLSDGPFLVFFLIGPFGLLLNGSCPFSVFGATRLGAFSCCAMNHDFGNETIPCDKIAVRSVLSLLMEAKVEYLQREGCWFEMRYLASVQVRPSAGAFVSSAVGGSFG